MAGRKGMKHYSAEIKREAVRMHIEDGVTTREIMKRLGILSERRVTAWCEKYRKEGEPGLLQHKPKGRPRKIDRSGQEQMEYELKRLRMENELLRNFLYEAGRR